MRRGTAASDMAFDELFDEEVCKVADCGGRGIWSELLVVMFEERGVRLTCVVE